MPLDLHCIGKNSPRKESFYFQVDVFSLLETLKTFLLTDLVQIVHKFQTDRLVSTKLLITTRHFVFPSKLLNKLPMRDSNNYHKGLCRFSMNEYFLQFVTLQIDILHFFCSHVLALLQLEDVLLAVDDAQAPRLRTQHAHVTSF